MTSAPKTASPDTAVGGHELDADSLSAIRSILTEEEAPAPRKSFGRASDPAPEAPQPTEAPARKAQAFPRLRPADPAPTTTLAAKPAKRGLSLRRKASAATKPAPAAQPRPAAQPAVQGDEGGLMDRIKSYRPTPAHIALGAFALLVLFRPWLVIGLTVLSVIILIGVFLIVGYDGFWKGVMKLGRWYSARRPERAVILNARLDRFAMKWDAILDRFPEGSVDGLYLPDFGELAMADKRHAEAMERRLSDLGEKAS